MTKIHLANPPRTSIRRWTGGDQRGGYLSLWAIFGTSLGSGGVLALHLDSKHARGNEHICFLRVSLRPFPLREPFVRTCVLLFRTVRHALIDEGRRSGLALILSHYSRFSGYGGFSAGLAGYAVAMKQLHPDSELLAIYLPLRAKVRHPG